jgi:hypothetical protein
MYEIFISSLSWRLGHATWDIPIIRELLDRGHEVTIAGIDLISAFYSWIRKKKSEIFEPQANTTIQLEIIK